MENSGALDFSENFQSGIDFCTDSDDTEIIGLTKLGGGGEAKRPWTGSPYLGPRFRKSVTPFLKF